MIMRLFRKYLVFLFMLASLLGALHHHDDLNAHPDCQICVIKANLAGADLPAPVSAPDLLFAAYEAVAGIPQELPLPGVPLPIDARAPPISS